MQWRFDVWTYTLPNLNSSKLLAYDFLPVHGAEGLPGGQRDIIRDEGYVGVGEGSVNATRMQTTSGRINLPSCARSAGRDAL